MKLLRYGKIQIGQFRLKSTSLAMALVAISSTIAQAASQPPAALKRLEYFAGTWLCRQPADSNDPSGEFIWNVELGLNGFWYLGNAEQTEIQGNPQPINSQEFLGYDLTAGQLIRSVVVGNGNSYNMTADDWSNNKLVWSGTLVREGKPTPLRQEIIQDSPDKFTATYSVPGGESNWIPVVDETCDRQK